MSRLPSKAQAHAIAREFSRVGLLKVGPYVTPTYKALIERGWIARVAIESGEFPSGDPYDEYAVTEDGLMALRDFLIRRFK